MQLIDIQYINYHSPIKQLASDSRLIVIKKPPGWAVLIGDVIGYHN